MTGQAMHPVAIIGIGANGLASLTADALTRLDAATHVFGGKRHLALVADVTRAEARSWPSPWSALKDEIRDLQASGARVTVIVSGDPVWFSAGTGVLDALYDREYEVFAQSGAFALMAARIPWALEVCDCITLHGRPVSSLVRWLQPGRRLLVLGDGKTGVAMARLLIENGFTGATITAFSDLGADSETRVEATAADWPEEKLPALTSYAVELPRHVPDGLPVGPGLPDHAFEHDGQLTKQAVRAITLAKLRPNRHELLWDLGAGCGSVAIEWLRMEPRSFAVAVEQNETRLKMIDRNRVKLGVANLKIAEGSWHDDLPQQGEHRPDAVFIGGGVTAEGLEQVWKRLNPGGRLVANVVTLKGEQIVTAFAQTIGQPTALSRISVEEASAIGTQTGWRPQMTVTQLAAVKS